MKAFLAAALITVFAFTANATTTHTKSDTAGAFKPHSAPAIELKDLDGNVVKLSDYAGKVVVVNFFATWCPPCRWEIPQFNDLQKKYGADVQFLGVSLDEEGADKVKDWKTKHPVEYPVLMTDPDRKILDTYDVKSAIPVTFVIDRKGVVQMEYTPKRGDTPGAIIESAFKPLIAQH
jgi:peroxiredoxin